MFREDAHGEMRGEPDSAKQQNDSENEFRTDGDETLEGRVKGRNVDRGLHENKHCAESHRDDEHGG